jgi:hypothetical protein
MLDNHIETIKIYIKIDQYGYVIDIQSSIFLQDTYGWIMIDEGHGDKYAHGQSQYLRKALMNELGMYNYKYTNGKLIEV